MRVSAAFLLLALASFGGLASADIPPPPDLYSGPSKVAVAGLNFVRQSPDRTLSQESQRSLLSDACIFLTDCNAAHPNCRLAKKQKVMGFVVSAINGTPMRNDLGAFQADFKTTPKGHKVLLTLVTPAGFEPSRKVDVAFDRK